MSEPRTPRKAKGTKKGKKVTKNKIPTPLKVKIPTPVKKIRLTTPTKKNEIEIIDTIENVTESDESDVQDGEEDEIDWRELEEELERNAAKSNLSTINVKSILHHILSDKRVIELAQRVEKDPTDTKLGDVFGETKLTRSKARLLGYQPLPLPNEGESKPTILDVEFPESSSDDEEYHPVEEDEPISDEDISHLSDFFSETTSPCMSTSSIKRSKIRGISETLSESDSSVITTPDLRLKPRRSSSRISNKEAGSIGDTTFAVPDLPSSQVTEQEEEDLIASRTRSRFPMPDVEVEEIAASFVPPDCTIDFSAIQTIDDPEELYWRGWLSDLSKPLKLLNDTNDDDINDEDFNYMQEVDEEDTELENEEFRNDKATRVPQKELKELINDLLFGYEDEEYTYCENLVNDEPLIRPEEELQPASIEAAESLSLLYDQREHIIAQMQQHVQLLTQIYMTTCTIQELKNEASQCKQYVEELYHFQNKAIENSDSGGGHLHKELSTFCTPGISDAYRIIKSLQGMSIRCATYKGKQQNIPINDTIVEMFATEPYFATYIELLPDQGMESPLNKKGIPRMKFTKSEDNLLALGLDQFKGPDKFEKIHTHLLPTWTAKQIKTRAKNLGTRYINNVNPVAVLRKFKVLPELEAKVKITVPREISKLPLIKLPRTIWKGRIIPSWYLRKVKTLQLDCKTGPPISMEQDEVVPKTEDELETQSNVQQQQQPIYNNNNNASLNNAKEGTPFYGATSFSLPGMTMPTNSCSMSAPSGPVIMMPTPMVYQPMPMGNGYAMVPMMYCPVVSGSGNMCGNFSTPKTMLTNNNCYSDPTGLLNRNPATSKQLTPVRFQNANHHSAEKANVKRALNYSKCTKKTKSRNKRLDNKTNSSMMNINPQTSPLGPAYTTQTFTEVVASGQASNNNPVKTICTPVKNIMNEFGITSINSDNFNVPFTSLMKDLPSPSKFPHLIPSPLKKQLNCFQGLVTATKIFEKENNSQESCELNMNNSNIFGNNFQSQNMNNIVTSNRSENTLASEIENTNTAMNQSLDKTLTNMSALNDEIETIDTSILAQTDTTLLNVTCINNNSTTTNRMMPTASLINSVCPISTPIETIVTSIEPSYSSCNSSQFVSSHSIMKPSTNISESKEMVLTTSTKINSHPQTTLLSPSVSKCVPVALFPNPPICSVVKSECKEKVVDSSSLLSNSKTKTLDVSDILVKESNSLNENDNVNTSLCTNENDLCTGDESSLDGGGMDSQTDDNVSADETQDKRDSKTTCKKPPDKGSVKKGKTRKRSTKTRKKAKRKNLFNREEKLQQKVQDFARMYLNLVKTTLADNQELLEQFSLLMQEGSSQQLSKLQTYYKVASLFKDYPVLIDNFSGFLDQHEARHVGKFLHWLTRHQVINFHLSCEHFFYNTPGWYMKIVQKILDVTEEESDSEKIFNAVIPMFRGNQNLINQFKRLFPDLAPPPCSDDEFEVIDFNAVTTGSKEMDDFEEIQFQPPDADVLNDYSKRKSKSSRRGTKNKFTKKKSNTNITASKLRDLANKRKKSKICSSDGAHSDINLTADEDIDENSKENNKENIITEISVATSQVMPDVVPISTYPSTISSYNVEQRVNNFVGSSEINCFKTEIDDTITSIADDGFDVVDALTNCTVKCVPLPIKQNNTLTTIPPVSLINVGTSILNQSSYVQIVNSDNLHDNIDKKIETIVVNPSQNVEAISHVPLPVVDEVKNPNHFVHQVENAHQETNSINPVHIKDNILGNNGPLQEENIIQNVDDVKISQIDRIYNSETKDTVLNTFETYVTSKKPISNNIIPFKTMKSDFHASFLDSSNSHSGNSQSEETSQTECKEITCVETTTTEPTELTFHSLFPCESNQIMLANQENQNIFNTQCLPKFEPLTYTDASKQISSTPLKSDVDPSSLTSKDDSKVTVNPMSDKITSESRADKSEKTPPKQREDLFNSHSFLNETPDKSKTLLLPGSLHAEQDLTFQEHSIQTNHLVLSDESQPKGSASSLSFAGILSKIPAKSPFKSKSIERGLMGPPTHIFEKPIEPKHKEITTDGELTFSEHSISTVQLATDIKGTPSRKSQHPGSPAKSSAIVSTSSDLTFTGKITPLSFEKESMDISTLPSNSVINSNDDQSKVKSHLDSITSANSQNLCQKSVDIDFKVMDNKVFDPIEISNDTKTNESHINKKISPIIIKDSQSQNQKAINMFHDANSNSNDEEVEMITNRSVHLNITPSSSHTTSTPIDPAASNDARQKLNFDNPHENSQDAPVNSSLSQDCSKSPSIKTSFSKVLPLPSKRIKKPRKLSRSEIITLAESTSFQEDSCSSFEDNYCFTPAHRREQSLSESSTTKETLGSLPYQKMDVAEYCNTEKDTRYTTEVGGVKPPLPPSSLNVQKFDEESQQSNRSFSGYASSPATPLFVSSYVEVKTNDADTPNSSFNVVDSITADLILKSETCPQPNTTNAKPGIVENELKNVGISNSKDQKTKEKKNGSPKKKIRKKKEDVRKLRLSDINENENEEKDTSPAKATDDTKKVTKKRKRKESPISPRKKSKTNQALSMTDQLNAAMKTDKAETKDGSEKEVTTPRKSKRISDRKAKDEEEEEGSPEDEQSLDLPNKTPVVGRIVKTPQKTPECIHHTTPKKSNSKTTQGDQQKINTTPQKTPQNVSQKTPKKTPQKQNKKTPQKTPRKSSIQKTTEEKLENQAPILSDKSSNKTSKKPVSKETSKKSLTKAQSSIVPTEDKVNLKNQQTSKSSVESHIQRAGTFDTKKVKKLKKDSHSKNKKNPDKSDDNTSNVDTGGKNILTEKSCAQQTLENDDLRTVCVQINVPSRMSSKKTSLKPPNLPKCTNNASDIDTNELRQNEKLEKNELNVPVSPTKLVSPNNLSKCSKSKGYSFVQLKMTETYTNKNINDITNTPDSVLKNKQYFVFTDDAENSINKVDNPLRIEEENRLELSSVEVRDDDEISLCCSPSYDISSHSNDHFIKSLIKNMENDIQEKGNKSSPTKPGQSVDETIGSSLNIRRKSDVVSKRKQSLNKSLKANDDKSKRSSESCKKSESSSSASRNKQSDQNERSKDDRKAKSNIPSDNKTNANQNKIEGKKIIKPLEKIVSNVDGSRKERPDSSTEKRKKNESSNNERKNSGTRSNEKSCSVKSDNKNCSKSERINSTRKGRTDSSTKYDDKGRSGKTFGKDGSRKDDDRDRSSKKDERDYSSSSSRSSISSKKPQKTSPQSSHGEDKRSTNKKSSRNSSSRYNDNSSHRDRHNSSKRRRDSDDERESSSKDIRNYKKVKYENKEKEDYKSKRQKDRKTSEKSDQVVFDVKNVLSSYEDFLMEDEDTTMSKTELECGDSRDTLFDINMDIKRTSTCTDTISLPSNGTSNISKNEVICNIQSNMTNSKAFPQDTVCLKDNAKSQTSTNNFLSNSLTKTDVTSKIDLKSYLSRTKSKSTVSYNDSNSKIPSSGDGIVVSSDLDAKILQECQRNLRENNDDLGNQSDSTAEYVGSPLPYEKSCEEDGKEKYIRKSDHKINSDSNSMHKQNSSVVPKNTDDGGGASGSVLKQNDLSVTVEEFSYSEWPAPSPQIPLPTRNFDFDESSSVSTMDESSGSNITSSRKSPRKGCKKQSSSSSCASITSNRKPSDSHSSPLNTKIDIDRPRETVPNQTLPGAGSKNLIKWTQSEDQVILTTFMAMNGNEKKTCSALESSLSERSLLEIMSRIDYLKEHLYEKFGISSGGESDDEEDTDSQESSS